MTAPSPQRAASAEERERLASTIAEAMETFQQRDGYQKAIIVEILEDFGAILVTPLLDRITAAEARAKTERSNREQWAIQAHEFATAADRLAREKDAATADRDRLADEVARLRTALEPFGAEADRYDPDEGDGEDLLWDCARSKLRVRNLRLARRALTATGGTTDGQAAGGGDA